MINMKNPINNSQRKFGSANTYYLGQVTTEDNSVTLALFTEKELENAIKRAAANVEDLTDPSKFSKFMMWLSSFFGPSNRE